MFYTGLGYVLPNGSIIVKIQMQLYCMCHRVQQTQVVGGPTMRTLPFLACR